ncbi:extracellular solute-binding protein [Streptomyces sp. NPDC005507]|uniref:ABC transporter substrate-binding protein n=1 Tax=unclassified Streptomyces TaxID=2593676 RepID=UPI0033AEC775
MRRRSVLLATAALAATAACGSREARKTADELKFSTLGELRDAAKKEGSVVVYTQLTEPDVKRLSAGFENKYGIPVKSLRLGGTTAKTRFESETQAGSPSADVLVLSESRYFGTATRNGHIVPLERTQVLPLVPGFPKNMLVEHDRTAVIQVSRPGCVYNTERVKKSELPRSWKALLDPRWKGKLTTVSPGNSLGNLLQLDLLRDTYGLGFLHQLRPQLGRLYSSMVPMHEAIASGEALLGFESVEFFVHAMATEGSPLGFLSMPPAYYPIVTPGVASAAPHPAAARLLTHYLLTPEGARTIATGVGVFSPYDQDKIPSDFKVQTDGQVDAAQRRTKEITDALT